MKRTTPAPPPQPELAYPNTGGPFSAEQLQAFADMPFGRLGECVREHHDPLWGLARDIANPFLHDEEQPNEKVAWEWACWVESLRPMAAAQELSMLGKGARTLMLTLFEDPDDWKHQGACGWGEKGCEGDYLCSQELCWPDANSDWLDEVRAHLTNMLNEKDTVL